jgi:transcriptional regulator with XRE-family HTH domain
MSICKRCAGTGVEPCQLAKGKASSAKRKAAGISQRKLAHALGVSPSFLCQLERGQRTWGHSLYKKYHNALMKGINATAQS